MEESGEGSSNLMKEIISNKSATERVVVGIKEERGREEGRRETHRSESCNNLSPGWRTNITI
jgi:flagellar biosynthesis/type III secretory pathway ATPase